MIDFRPSATRIAKAEACFRRWVYDELYHIKDPNGDDSSLVFGTEMHRQLEQFLKGLAPLDVSTKEGQVAFAGLHYLPVPGTPGLEIEKSFVHNLGGVRCVGTVDVTWSNHPAVHDHKSTTRLGYAKTREMLTVDIQAAVYGDWCMARHETDWFHSRWIYYSKAKREACASDDGNDGIIRRAEIEPTLERAKRTLVQMYRAAHDHIKPQDAPYNGGNCWAYNKPCPHIRRCNLSSKEKFEAFAMALTKADFAQEMARRKAQAEGSAVPPTINPPQASPPAMSTTYPAGTHFHPAGTDASNAEQYWPPGASAWIKIDRSAPPPPPPPPAAPAAPPPPPSPPAPPAGPPAPPPPSDVAAGGGAPPPPPPPAVTELTREQATADGSPYFPVGTVFHRQPVDGVTQATHFRVPPSNDWLDVPSGRLTAGIVADILAAKGGAPPPKPDDDTPEEIAPKGRGRPTKSTAEKILGRIDKMRADVVELLNAKE